MAEAARQRVQRQEDDILLARRVTVVRVAILRDVQIPTGIPAEQRAQQWIVEIPSLRRRGGYNDPGAYSDGCQNDQPGQGKHHANEYCLAGVQRPAPFGPAALVMGCAGGYEDFTARIIRLPQETG